MHLVDEQVFHLITTVLNPAILWLILLFIFAEWRFQRRTAWAPLFVAWFANLVYLYTESLGTQSSLLGIRIAPFLGANISLPEGSRRMAPI